MSIALNVVAGFAFAAIVAACSASDAPATPATGLQTAPDRIVGKVSLQASWTDARSRSQTRS